MNTRLSLCAVLAALCMATLASAQAPFCSLNYCTYRGQTAACRRVRHCRWCPKWKRARGSRINCGWWSKSQWVRCPRYCSRRCKPVYGSDGKKYCNKCTLKRAACKSHFAIYGPVKKVSAKPAACAPGCAWRRWAKKCVCPAKPKCARNCLYNRRWKRCICDTKPKCAAGCRRRWGRCYCAKKGRRECRRLGCRYRARGGCSCRPSLCKRGCQYSWALRKCVCPHKPVSCKRFGPACYYHKRSAKCRCPKVPVGPMPSPEPLPLKL